MRRSQAHSMTAAALFIMSAAEVPNFFSAPAPSWLTIRRFGHDNRDKHTIRLAERLGFAESVALGVATSVIGETQAPFWGCLLMAMVQIAGYEWALANTHANAQSIDDPRNTGVKVANPASLAETQAQSGTGGAMQRRLAY